MFLFLNEAYPKLSSYPTPDYAFKTHLRTCTIISYILFLILVHLRFGVLTKLILTNKKSVYFLLEEDTHSIEISQ